MCGLFFSFDASTSGKLLKENSYETVKNNLHFRGPDGKKSVTGENWFAYHSWLKITGDSMQPMQWRDGFFLYNGEIYNHWDLYSSNYSDSQYFQNELNKKGISCLSEIDGEFAMIIFDEKNHELILVTDPFSTKPLYLSIYDQKIGVSSYDYILSDLGFQNIIRCKSNSMIRINIDNLKLDETFPLREFDFVNSHKDHFDAFSNAILKRAKNTQRNLYLPLSSGHDSGLIAAELMKQKINFHIYGFEHLEVKEVFQERFNLLEKYGAIFDILELSPSKALEIQRRLIKEIPKYDFVEDAKMEDLYEKNDIRKISGFISSAYMAMLASKKGQVISLSGQGADEIISDYYNVHTNSRRSYFKGDWSRAKSPWPNFYSGWNRAFLDASERIVGHFGIENRYPFLDFNVVQEFLYLSPSAKGRSYKAPITEMLKKLGFPYHDKKMGFAGFNQKQLYALKTNS